MKALKQRMSDAEDKHEHLSNDHSTLKSATDVYQTKTDSAIDDRKTESPFNNHSLQTAEGP